MSGTFSYIDERCIACQSHFSFLLGGTTYEVRRLLNTGRLEVGARHKEPIVRMQFGTYVYALDQMIGSVAPKEGFSVFTTYSPFFACRHLKKQEIIEISDGKQRQNIAVPVEMAVLYYVSRELQARFDKLRKPLSPTVCLM